jgi:hypothetical protein
MAAWLATIGKASRLTLVSARKDNRARPFPTRMTVVIETLRGRGGGLHFL